MVIKKIVVLLILFILTSGNVVIAQNWQKDAKQGYSMKMKLDNRGAFGRVSYNGVIGGTDPGGDSIGLEYPIGRPFEHIFGAGIWVGGILDTTTVPGSTPVLVKGVTVGYEGWQGGGGSSYFEFFPGGSPADTIFRIFKNADGSYPPKPPAWDLASGLEGAIPYNPISDADYYMKYDDNRVRVSGHVPLNLKVFQSSYAWRDPYAQAVIILEYRIINAGRKLIDSAYIGFFFDADVGPYRVANYAQRNFNGYYQNSRTMYIHNPADRGSTPVGCALLTTSRPLDSLRYAFRWWNGPQHPNTDADKYDRLSSGIVDSNQALNNLGDSRSLFGFGPFTLKPSNPPLPGTTGDTIKIAVAIVSGSDPAGNHLRQMQTNASHALNIYLNQGIKVPATPPSPPLHVEIGFRKVKLNWRWTAEDSIRGKRNPLASWDTTNRRAETDTLWSASEAGFRSRISPPYPAGIDPHRGGRNFESYRLWRSEQPNYPDESFTLVKQWDISGDGIDFDYGLDYDFIDSNLVRGKRYVYAVTSRSIPNIAYQQIVQNGQVVTVPVDVEAIESAFGENLVVVDLPFSVSTEADKVRVVPNPYRTDVDYTFESGGYEKNKYDWNENKRVLKFINLPNICTIRVFSLAGDLIRTIEHDGGGGTFPRGDHDMPLVSESNRALASGVYLFTVESSFGTQVGKFVIIR